MRIIPYRPFPVQIDLCHQKLHDGNVADERDLKEFENGELVLRTSQ